METAHRALAPRDQGTNPSEENEKERDRNVDAIVIRRVDALLLAGNRFHYHGEKCAPQDRKAACMQDQVIE